MVKLRIDLIGFRDMILVIGRLCIAPHEIATLHSVVILL